MLMVAIWLTQSCSRIHEAEIVIAMATRITGERKQLRHARADGCWRPADHADQPRAPAVRKTLAFCCLVVPLVFSASPRVCVCVCVFTAFQSLLCPAEPCLPRHSLPPTARADQPPSARSEAPQ